jgi:hypothetical protein
VSIYEISELNNEYLKNRADHWLHTIADSFYQNILTANACPVDSGSRNFTRLTGFLVTAIPNKV